MENEKCCGTCQYHRTDADGEWICTNVDSDNNGIPTAYDDTGCFDYEKREK